MRDLSESQEFARAFPATKRSTQTVMDRSDRNRDFSCHDIAVRKTVIHGNSDVSRRQPGVPPKAIISDRLELSFVSGNGVCPTENHAGRMSDQILGE